MDLEEKPEQILIGRLVGVKMISIASAWVSRLRYAAFGRAPLEQKTLVYMTPGQRLVSFCIPQKRPPVGIACSVL
ncbi:hypothetical protein IVB30_36705 [Bradyrhizobium sp. 200]|nr:hypothetical protein IVB30_36705 [Bradyrhizobium sp. 200]